MEKTIIEVNGVKLEVDLSSARVIENYCVGDNVKVLIKEGYNGYQSYSGVIVGFDNFKVLPTIVVAYLKLQYNEASIGFLYYNAETKDAEICQARPEETMFNRSRVTELLDKEIVAQQKRLDDLHAKKAYFEANFQAYFQPETERAY